MSPSPRSHVYRLILLLILVGAGFLGIRQFAIPTSWDKEGWYRGDALAELKTQPLTFGGNESCAGSSCHESDAPASHQAQIDLVTGGGHEGLACEGCHGPLSDHVQNGQKVKAANRESSSALCLNCHLALASRPEHHTKFSEDTQTHKLLKIDTTKPCRTCHNPHRPK